MSSPTTGVWRKPAKQHPCIRRTNYKIALIKELEFCGITLKNPHQMRIDYLEALAKQHEISIVDLQLI